MIKRFVKYQELKSQKSLKNNNMVFEFSRRISISITTEVMEIIDRHIDWQSIKVFEGRWQYIHQSKNQSDLNSELVISTHGLQQRLWMVDQIGDYREFNQSTKALTAE